MFNDPPQSLVGDAHKARHPPLDPARWAIEPGQAGLNEAMMQEEGQVLPSEAWKVMRLASPTARRAGEQRYSLCGHLQVQPMQSFLDVQPISRNLPRSSQTRPQREQLLSFHVSLIRPETGQG